MLPTVSSVPAAAIGSSASGASSTAAMGGYVNGSGNPWITGSRPYRSAPCSHVRPPAR